MPETFVKAGGVEIVPVKGVATENSTYKLVFRKSLPKDIDLLTVDMRTLVRDFLGNVYLTLGSFAKNIGDEFDMKVHPENKVFLDGVNGITLLRMHVFVESRATADEKEQMLNILEEGWSVR